MISLVRVDDRLIHGQVLCAWVPHVDASVIVLVTEETPSAIFMDAFTRLCSDDNIRVMVLKAEQTVEAVKKGYFENDKVILIMNSIAEAVELYDAGYSFASINIGNIHHDDGGARKFGVATFDDNDERMLDTLIDRGVKVDIRALPNKEAVEYVKGGRK